MSDDVVDLAHERLHRTNTAAMTFSTALRGLGEGMAELYPDRETQIAQFGERLVVTIDLSTGKIDLRHHPSSA